MELIELKNKLLELQKLKDSEIKNHNYEKAAEIRDKEKLLRESIEKIEVNNNSK